MTAPSGHISPLSKDDIKQIQCVIGSILYYARAVDLTVLMALSTICKQTSKWHGKHHSQDETTR